MKFYKCNHCGQIVIKIKDTQVPLICCGEKMEEMEAGTVDAVLEKHVPVYTISNNIVNVKIGEVEHPMIEKHYIQFIAIKTNLGYQYKKLQPNDKPEANFALLNNEKVENVFEYCNLHGLWKK